MWSRSIRSHDHEFVRPGVCAFSPSLETLNAIRRSAGHKRAMAPRNNQKRTPPTTEEIVMIRTLVQWSWRGLLLSTLAAMSSCGGVPLTGQGGQLTGQLLPEDGAGGPPNDDGRPVSDNGSFALCGNRA